MPLPLRFLVLLFVGWVSREQQAVIEFLQAENRTLRELFGDKRLRFTPKQRRRLGEAGKPLGRRLLDRYASLVTPGTILRWYRELAASRYTAVERRGPGRPRKPPEVVAQVLELAAACPTYGYTPLRDTLNTLKVDVQRSTVKRILDEHGVVPAPERGSKPAGATS